MMGTATVQGDLWSARARYWATLQERVMLPTFEAVLTHLGVGPDFALLDIACGTGMAAMLASVRGATVSGIDAAAASIAIARERVPDGNFTIGEMEELPYPDQRFDGVTGFNAFQYAANPLHALQEARRVTRVGGQVALAFWGPPERCEHTQTLQAVNALPPPPPPGAPAPLALSNPGVAENLARQADLDVVTSGEVNCAFEYPDEAIALQAICSAGPVMRVINQVGEEAVHTAVRASLAPFRQADGSYRQNNIFRYLITRV